MTSIRTHLVARLLLVSALLLGTADVVIWITLDRLLDANIDGSLAAKARARASLVTQDERGVHVEWDGLDDPINGTLDVPDIVQLQSQDGHKLLAGSGALIPFPPLTDKTAYWKAPLPSGSDYKLTAIKIQPHLDEDLVAQPGLQRVPPCVIVVATNRSGLDPDGRMAQILVGATLFCLLAIGTLFWREVNKGLAPLKHFGTKVSKITANSLQQRFKTGLLPVELVPIAEKLDDLLSRLEASFNRERRFSGDVSHELRTPIAELRSISEVMLRRPTLDGPIRQAFQDVFDSSCQMGALVSALLDLLRDDHHAQPLVIERVDLAQLLQQSWRPYIGKARIKELQISIPDSPEIIISSAPRLLQPLLSNLLSNAVEYTPNGGQIAVSFANGSNDVKATFQNTTEPLTKEDLPRFFERLWKKDKVRSGSEHLGLGLSVALLLCQKLKIDLRPSLPNPNLLVFELVIPHHLPPAPREFEMSPESAGLP